MEDVIITLDVGGTIFKASSSVLAKCSVFKSMLKDVPYEGQTIYIDRCGHIFKHTQLRP